VAAKKVKFFVEPEDGEEDVGFEEEDEEEVGSVRIGAEAGILESKKGLEAKMVKLMNALMVFMLLLVGFVGVLVAFLLK